MEVWGGIECSLNRIGDDYFDQLAYDDQYNRPYDLEKICSLGISKIRYPILWEKNFPDENKGPNWIVAENLDYLRSRNISVIAGLVHHGSGPLYCNVQCDDFPEKLAVYAAKVARRFPWINDYTPVNEPLTTARFCGLYGIWHPHKKDSLSFLQILLNECRGTVMAMLAIRKVNSNARLVFTEDLTKIHGSPLLQEQVTFENHRRWLSLDLMCGKVTNEHSLWNYLLREGILAEQLQFFSANPMPPDILGFNYYITSERFLDEEIGIYPSCYHGGNGQYAYADIEAVRTSKTELEGPESLLRSAWERYHLPMAITEAHLNCGREDQLRWLKYMWLSAERLEKEGIKIQALTFWSLFGAYGWDKLLTTCKGTYETGAFDMSSGAPRATAVAKLIHALATGTPYNQPLIGGPGWWERSIKSPKNSHPLFIYGIEEEFGEELVRICEQKRIPFIFLTKTQQDISDPTQFVLAKARYNPWAIISAESFINTNVPIGLAILCRDNGVQFLKIESVIDPKNAELSEKSAKLQVHNPDALIVRMRFSATNLPNLINEILNLLIDAESGIWHCTNEGTVNRSILQNKPQICKAAPVASLTRIEH